MKGTFTAPAGALIPAVQYAAKWLDTKPAIAVLGCVMLSVDDGKLTVGSQSELAAARAVIDVEGDASGRFLVSGRLLAALVATFPDKPITFDQTDSMVTMTAGRYKVQLPAMPENDYPSLADLVPAVGTVEGAVLVDSARRIGTMASKDLTNRVTMTGIYFWFEGVDKELTMSATDSLRASRETIEWQPVDDGAPVAESLVLPAAVLIDAGDAFDGLEPVTIGWNQGAVSISTPTRSLVTRTLGGEYPDLGPLFGQRDKRTHTATIKVKDLMIPLKRADQLAEGEHRHVAIDLRANSLILRSSTEGKGDGGEEVDAGYDGPDCTIITRSAILHGLLATVPGDTVALHITPGTYQSVFATSPANPAWTHLFMPIRHV